MNRKMAEVTGTNSFSEEIGVEKVISNVESNVFGEEEAKEIVQPNAVNGCLEFVNVEKYVQYTKFIDKVVKAGETDEDVEINNTVGHNAEGTVLDIAMNSYPDGAEKTIEDIELNDCVEHSIVQRTVQEVGGSVELNHCVRQIKQQTVQDDKCNGHVKAAGGTVDEYVALNGCVGQSKVQETIEATEFHNQFRGVEHAETDENNELNVHLDNFFTENTVKDSTLNDNIMTSSSNNKEDDVPVEDLTVHCEPTLLEEEDFFDEDINDRIDLDEESVDPLEFLEVDQSSNAESIDNDPSPEVEEVEPEGASCSDPKQELGTLVDSADTSNHNIPMLIDVSEDSEDSQISEYRANLAENLDGEDTNQNAMETRERRNRLDLPVCEVCGYIKKELSSPFELDPSIDDLSEGESHLLFCDCASDKVECRVCSKMVRYSCYTTHLRRHKGPVLMQGLFCHICERTFKSLKSLKHHQLICKSKKYYKCVHCSETFNLKRLLSEHLKEYHRKKEEEDTVSCEICCIVFDNSSSKKDHIIKVHVAAQRFVCGTCGEAFITDSQMRRHLKTHNQCYSCKDCGLEFGAKKDLLFHRLQHRSLKDLRCKICGEKFQQLSEYSEHRQTPCSLPETTFCDLCSKSFRDKNALRKHLLTHTPLSERSVLCDVCKRSFSGPSALKKHVRLIHTNLRPYTCEFCSKSFNQLCKLKYHIVIHSSDKPVSCEICNKAFSNDKDIKIHMRTHTGEKPFRCNLCGKTFRQRGHVKTHQIVHTKERPFNCQLCDKTFGLPSSLKKHMKLHASRIIIPVSGANPMIWQVTHQRRQQQRMFVLLITAIEGRMEIEMYNMCC